MDTPLSASEATVAEAPVVPVIDPMQHEAPKPHSSAGSVIAILLIVVLLVIGAFYVWGQRLSEARSQQYVPATAP